MTCSSFGKCGSCVLYQTPYEEQLEIKKNRLIELFSDFDMPSLEVFHDKDNHFRARAEFRIWHDGDKSYYGMFGLTERRIVTIDECNIVDKAISDIMKPFLDEVVNNEFLRVKLYAVEFLSNSKGELIITMIYHKKWDEDEIRPHIEKLKQKFPNTDYVVRRKGKKLFIDKNYLIEELSIKGEIYKYKQIEATFTQPNRAMNQKMIEWVMDNSEDLSGDLVEMYCGHGNFTIPLSKRFRKVIATEIAQQSIDAAFYNADINNVDNITFLAMSAADFARLKDEDSPLLAKYNLKNILVDPPRAGLDAKSRKFTDGFDNIIYISCNPETLKRDLETLSIGREIKAFAFFDQFPWTNHAECGVIMTKK
jgi:tRNA (uracil-5-)-methyltransferase